MRTSVKSKNPTDTLSLGYRPFSIGLASNQFAG